MLIFTMSTPTYALVSHVNVGDKLKFNEATPYDSFGSLLDWNGIVFGDVNSIIDVEGTLAVGENFYSSNGFSGNSGAYGSNPAITDDVAFLVGGNVNISGYGNIWGQTVIGNEEGNTYKLSNVTSNNTTNGQYVVVDSSEYFIDAKNTAYTVKAAIESLAANGEYNTENGIYTFIGETDKDIVVYNVDDSVFDSYLFDFTIAEDQTIIVNFTTSDKINLKYGGFRINGNTEPDYLRKYNRNIILNIVNSTEVETTSCELYGILLAPDSTLTGKGSNVCGTSVLGGLIGTNGFELHVGYNEHFIPSVFSNTETLSEEPDNTGPDSENYSNSYETSNIRIDVPKKMATYFEDGNIYYGGEIKEVVVGKEYMFRMCAVNWDNGIYDENNGIAGTVAFRMIAIHNDEFKELAGEAVAYPEKYTVKGIDIIDDEAKTIYINCDAEDVHLETDVNNFFVAYRFHFTGNDYNKMTGIDKVINNPTESLSVNLPIGSTITCDAYIDGEKVDSNNVFITKNSGEGEYDNVYLTSVNDYTWPY